MALSGPFQERVGLTLVGVICLCLLSEPCLAKETPAPSQTAIESDRAAHEQVCSEIGMKFVDFDDRKGKYGEICQPRRESKLSGTTKDLTLAKIRDCVTRGWEAVLVADLGVVCARPHDGGNFLDDALVAGSEKKRSPQQFFEIPSTVCPEKGRQSEDKRLLPARIIKDLVREASDEIDPRGVRLIGGVYCDGLDLFGLDVPFSIILDHSTFFSYVDIRNFRTKGDLSLDNTAIYGDRRSRSPDEQQKRGLRLVRAQIGGSIYATFAFIESLKIEDSVIKGSLNLRNTVVPGELLVEKASISGDVSIPRQSRGL